MKTHLVTTGLLLWSCVPTPAEEIQHLDASVVVSLRLNASGVVTNWVDQSGSTNNALASVGSVTYPSTNLLNGLKALNFGPSQSSLQLFSSVASDAWLNQLVNTNGFCVLVAFRARTLTNQLDVLGNNSTVTSPGFLLRCEGSGAMRAVLGGQNLTKSGASVVVGDSMVWAFNYNRTAGQAEFWDSKNYASASFAASPGDFSLSAAVTLGSTTAAARFLDGQVGEVQVYDAAMSAADFKQVRQNLAAKWAGVLPPLEINWRVIPADTNYPSDDAIMAALSVADLGFTHPLPADPANQDCSATFQEAIDLVSAAGGGTVFVPAGQYRFDGNLVVKGNVTLRGRWVKPATTQPVDGTILKIHQNRNNGSASPFITLNQAAGVRDLAFWHPEQTATNIVPYPFAIGSAGSVCTVENVTLVNPYQGMNFSTGSFLNMKHAYGSPLYRGYLVDRAYAVPRMEGAHFSPSYWVWSGLAGAPSAGGQHETFMKTNGIAILIRELDAGHVLFSDVSGYKVGLQYERSPVSPYDNAGEQTIMGNVFTNCTEALRVESVKSLKILQCGFYGITYGIRHITDGDLLLTDCTISGGAEAVHDDPTTSVHSFNFQGCTFNGSINVTNKGTLSAVSCNFVRNGVDILLNPGVSRAIISGCTFADGPNITNNSGAAAGDIQISHTPVASQVTPPLPTTYDKVRKPDKVTLFNVLNFGATGDGTTDDTVAVQSALQGAQTNGGGIVFFPAGKYRMTKNLNVGAGIELRGVHGGRHTPDSTTLGSVITINHGKGSDTGTAFITLGDRSGIRGLTFHYPDQSYLTPYKYPFMIRCQGFRNYLIDDAATDAYQAVDLDNADQHLVEYSFFGAWKKAYQIGGGSENGRIQNLHVKWDFWRDSALDEYPPNITEHDRGEVTCGKNLNTFTLNNCSNQTLFAIFNHACHTFITQNGGSGAAYGVAAEELQRGVVLNTNAASGRFDFVVCAVNVHNQGDWAGKYAFMVNSNFTGDAVFYNTFFRGNPEYLISSDSGNLVLQQGDFNSGGSRGVAVIKAGGNVTMDKCGYGIPFDLDVPAEGSMKSWHTHFDGGYGNMGVVGVVSNILNTYAGSVIMADINQAPPRARGITINTSNVAPVLVNTFPAPSGSRSTMDYVSQFYGYHRVSGSNILFNITDPDFTNAAAGSVDIKIQYLEDTDGTVKVYYDSTSGEKLGATWAISATNGAWANKTIQVNDARFNSPTNDIRIEIIGTTADPVFAHVSVESDSFLGLPGSNNPPGITALFTGMPTTGARPLAVTFTDQSTGSITNLLWAFGDGQTTNTAGGAIIAHTYTTAGSYPVTLIASGIGGSSTNTKSGYVTVNLPPSPRIDGISVAGMTNILLTGTGGPTNGLHYYWVRSATNLTVPLMNWSVLSTNPFHADGSFSSLLPASPVAPQRFYRLQLP